MIRWLLKNRFVKFGSVGFTGTFVNLGVLYLGQETIFLGIDSPDSRLSLSLALAIVCATASNFSLNRIWTWADRRERIARHYFLQLGQYFVACWLAIAIQFILTKGLALYIHYLAANVIAIVVSSVVNFLVNDAWTFGVKKDPVDPGCVERIERDA
ncbi:MAG: GtrA family protein [Methylococcaceae bacterium]|nr:GtrA family protein [Methylococcaceae bacterium]MCI0667529.1 GtrA family protein [Methylococcaceae bacterium]MCI0732616.1 GtrA family protein [Methylococcaceae bacterium]